MSALKPESLVQLKERAWKVSALVDALHIIVDQDDLDGNRGPIMGLVDEIQLQSSCLTELLQLKAAEGRPV